MTRLTAIFIFAAFVADAQNADTIKFSKQAQAQIDQFNKDQKDLADKWTQIEETKRAYLNGILDSSGKFTPQDSVALLPNGIVVHKRKKK